MTKVPFAFTLAAFLVSAAFAGESSDFRVLSSDERGIVLEYNPRFFEPLAAGQGAKAYQNWIFENGQDHPDGKPGLPSIGVRAFLVALPGFQGHTVEILAGDFESIQNVDFEPVPRAEGDFDHLKKIYEESPDAYGRNEFFPQRIAELVHVGAVRGLALGSLHVSPIQYNPVSRTVRKYSRILLRINFGPPAYRIQRVISDPLTDHLAINYEVAKTWRVDPPAAPRIQFRNSVFANGTWMRFQITESGMYKMTAAALLGAGVPASTDPRTIRIYSNGGVEPPPAPTVPYPEDVQEIAVYVNDGGTPGSLDAADYILFYGQAPRGWSYDPAGRTFFHTISLYSEAASYWLTFGGAQSRLMAAVSSLADPSPFVPSSVIGKVFREDERTNPQNSGRQWLGQSFNPNDAATYLFPMPGFDPGQRMTYRFSLGARSVASSRFDISEHGASLMPTIFIGATGGGYFEPYVVMRSITFSPPSNGFTESRSLLRFSFLSGSSGAGYIDWIEVLYGRQLVAETDVFQFHSHDTSAVTSYSINGFTQGAPVWVFDVTRLDSVVRVTNPAVAGGQVTFQTQLTQGSAREFCVVGENAFKVLPSLQAFSNQNLHGDTTGVDLVIISHRDFLTAAQRLKAHRERPGPERLLTRVVDVDHLYNEFSGGQPGPVGIRNYLRYLYTTVAIPPRYVLLLGDGDYDYKRISTSGPNWMPVWETLESFAGAPLSSYATEDSIAIVAASPRVNFALGRLPVRSLQQANDVVNKIIEYETSVATEPWKLRVTGVGDDGVTTEGNDCTIHTSQVDNLLEMIPALFEKQKIYIAEFPTVVTSAGRRKPSVNQAIISKINEGTLILNFTGHGNQRLWTHEQVFIRETDFPLLTNRGKYFFLTAATCNYSQYDSPFDQSGGEQLVVKAEAGAIGTVSASRAVFSGRNDELNRYFFQQLFRLDSLGRVVPVRVGDAFFQTKQFLYAGLYDNDKKFNLMGDPSLRLAIPSRFAAVDSLNNTPASTMVQFRALDTASIVANVRDTVSGQLANFSGTALITVYDSDRRVTIDKPEECFVYTYTLPGGIIFRGLSRIDSGRIGSSFVIPKDISYTNNQGRISLFFWSSTEDGAGVTRNIQVGGTNPNAAADSMGPAITLYMTDRNFRPGDLVGENPMLLADLYDEHGINTSNTAIGHRLEAWIDGQSESLDLSQYYKSKVNSYQEGTIEYVLSGLAPGAHRIRLRAWDTYNNASTSQTTFDVAVSVGLRVYNIFNYPNPFSAVTTFTFQHNQLVPVDAEVKIYTVAGRLVQSLQQLGVPDQFVRVAWDGRDRDGDELANGVYLYKLVVRTQDGRFTSEALGKMSKVR